MDTLLKSPRVTVKRQTSAIPQNYVSHESAWSRLISDLEFNHFFVIAFCILVGSCLGSVATMLVFENNAPLAEFVVVLAFTMANLIACISQAPTRWVVNIF